MNTHGGCCWVRVRWTSSATCIGDRILVFGGFDGRRNHNTIHMLDCGACPRCYVFFTSLTVLLRCSSQRR